MVFVFFCNCLTSIKITNVLFYIFIFLGTENDLSIDPKAEVLSSKVSSKIWFTFIFN